VRCRVAWDASYCPLNEGIYFHRELPDEFGEKPETWRRLVVAHEMAHHVSNLRGLYIALAAEHVMIRELELQADCYSSSWEAWPAGGPL
jgi:predicted metalloprotease